MASEAPDALPTIYAHHRGEPKYQLIVYLRLGQGKRHRRNVDKQRHERYHAEQNIRYRPEEVKGGQVPKRRECDLVISANNRSTLGIMVERTSRFVILAKLYAPKCRCSPGSYELGVVEHGTVVAQDQGSEMTRHAELTARTGMKVYFADPRIPWQRGQRGQQ